MSARPSSFQKQSTSLNPAAFNAASCWSRSAGNPPSPITAHHRSEVAGGDAVAVAAAGRGAVVTLAEPGRRSIDQVEVQEDPASPQVLTNLPIDLPDAHEVSEGV